MKVRYTAESQALVRKERSRWRKYRDSKGLFEEELEEAKKYLATGPKTAVYGILGGRPVRKYQLPKCKVHLFYVIYEELDLVRIVTMWGSRRDDPPAFDDE